MLADVSANLPIPWAIPVVLVAILAASWRVYAVLVRRSTHQRAWLDLCEWAEARGFEIRPAHSAPVPPEVAPRLTGARGLCWLSDGTTTLAQFETTPDPPTPGAATPAPRRWQLLLRKVHTAWPSTGLRPATGPGSIVDTWNLASFPLVAPTLRFVVVGQDPLAARPLARSPLRALTPADIAVLLDGQHLILDFSTRPFDPISLSRIRALAEQLVANLPSLTD